jgi:hypothetical protein
MLPCEKTGTLLVASNPEMPLCLNNWDNTGGILSANAAAYYIAQVVQQYK